MKVRFESWKFGSESMQFRFLAMALFVLPLCLVPALAGAAETDRITVEDPTTGAVMFKVTSAGNVSAGSVSAVGNLGTGPNPPAYSMAAVKDGGSTVFSARTYAAPVTNRSIYLLERSGGSLASPTQLNDGDWIGSFQANAYIGSLGFYASAGVNFMVDGASTLNQRSPGKIVFQTAPSGGAMMDRLTIKNDGSIGIGTILPSQKLEVNGGVRLNTVVTKPGCDSTARGTFWLTQNGAGVMDALEVCVKNATEAYVWKAVW
jgi:hypothetical protein